MSTHNRIATAMAVVAMALVGCSRSAVQQTNAEVRLRGANAGDYHAVLVGVKSLVVTANGRALAVVPGQRNLNLSDTTQAWLAGGFNLPDGASSAHVALTLDDFGGFESAGAAGDVDARAHAIEFDAPAAGLALHGMATIEIDLSRSMIARDAETRVLLPQLRIFY